MKKTLIILAAVTACCLAGEAAVMGQSITQQIPAEDRVKSIDMIELKKKVEQARQIIEKMGDKAFSFFRKEKEKWLGEQAIFIAHAGAGEDKEGVFIIYPAADEVGKGALDMSRVNGKHFGRQAVAEKGRKKEFVWHGFMAGAAGVVPHVTAVAITPDGRAFAITAGSDNLLREQHFLAALVTAACDTIAIDGEKAFRVFSDGDSIFRFDDTYIYVLDGNANMLFDPGNPAYEGRNVRDFPRLFPGYVYPVMRTTFDKALAAAENNEFPRTAAGFEKEWASAVDAEKAAGEGWAAYLTPRPGEKEMSHKISYHRAVRGPDGKAYVVGCGVYLAKTPGR